MRRLATALAALALVALVAAPADARKRLHPGPAGIEGVVLEASCSGACTQPQPSQPVYSGSVTVAVQRASDGIVVATATVTDGRFRFKLRRGLYDLTAAPAATPVPPPPCGPQPQAQQICPPQCIPSKEVVCALESAPAVIASPCLSGETKRVRVRRHRFAHVELHVTNVCVAQAQ